MEQIARFFFENWEIFAWVIGIFLLFTIIGLLVFNQHNSIWDYRFAEEMLIEKVKTIKKVLKKILSILVCLCLIMSCIFLQYAQSWWSKISTVEPNVTVSISPQEGSYSQGQMIDFQVELTNLSEAPITELIITFPKSFSDNFVIDYLNSSNQVEYLADNNYLFDESYIDESYLVEWVLDSPPGIFDNFITGKQITAHIYITPDQMFKLNIPIQLTDYGNFIGEFTIKVGVTDFYIVTPIGPFGKNPEVTNYQTQTSTLSWTVLQVLP